MTNTTIHAGLEDVTVAETRLSRIDGEAGELTIAGFDIEDIATSASFDDNDKWWIRDGDPGGLRRGRGLSHPPRVRQPGSGLDATVERSVILLEEHRAEQASDDARFEYRDGSAPGSGSRVRRGPRVRELPPRDDGTVEPRARPTERRERGPRHGSNLGLRTDRTEVVQTRVRYGRRVHLDVHPSERVSGRTATVAPDPDPDLTAAMFAVQGAMFALYAREAHGGQVVDVSLYEPLFRLMVGDVEAYDAEQHLETHTGNASDQAASRNLYEATTSVRSKHGTSSRNCQKNQGEV